MYNMDEIEQASLQIVATQLEIENEILKHSSDEEKFEALAKYVEYLIDYDFSKLINILYRMDVSEEKIKEGLKWNKDGLSSGYVMAKLMIERGIQTAKTRAAYKKRNDL